MEVKFLKLAKTTAFCLLGIWLSSISAVDALSCSECNKRYCETPTNCPGGFVLDVCHCCQTCAKQLGDPCGGEWNLNGICDKDLECRYALDLAEFAKFEPFASYETRIYFYKMEHRFDPGKCVEKGE